MPSEPTLVGSSPTATDQNTEPPLRPEYPRPQLCRPDWINLNGPWDFEFDDLDVGLRDQWYIHSNGFGRQIRVPFTFEADQSGIGDRSFHERVGTGAISKSPRNGPIGASCCISERWITGPLAG
jgi:hypothetical protein